MQFPLILARDLPLGSEVLSPQDTLIVVRGNDKLERVPADAIRNISPKYAAEVPTTPIQEGEEHTIAWDTDGIYTFENGVWGKTPRLLTNWNDYNSESRFLLVNRPVELSNEEVTNARASLKISSATVTDEGLVKIAKSVDANDGGVITGPQLIDYIDAQISNIKPKTNEVINLGNYSGDVLIKGKNGEVLLTYDSATSTLYIGGPDVNVAVRSKDKTLIQNVTEENIVEIA